MRALLFTLTLAGCTAGSEEELELDLSDSYGEVDGTWDAFDDGVTFVGGVAYGNAFFRDDRDVVTVTTWDSPNCADDEWLDQQDGYLLEVPYDAGSGVEEGMVRECTDIDGSVSCQGVDFPQVQVDLDDDGSVRGDPVSGTLSILDDDGNVEATITFAVTYCGEE